MTDALDIDQSQAKKIQSKSEELQGDFAKDMAALYEKYEKRIREELTKDQRTKADRVLGKTPSHLFLIPKR